MIGVENSANPIHFGIVFVAIQREAMRSGRRLIDARSEPIRWEFFIRIVVLQHVPHQRDRLLVRVQISATEAFGVVVVQRADRVVAPVARGEVDGHHEVEIQAAFDELEEARLRDARCLADVDRSRVDGERR